jgi:O-antigen ligase
VNLVRGYDRLPMPAAVLTSPRVGNGTAALVLAGGLLCEVAAALAITSGRFQLLLPAIAAALALALVFRFPAAAVVLAVVLSAGVFHDDFFALPVPVLRPADLVVGALLLVSLVRPRRRTWGGTAGLLLGLFLAILVLSSVATVSAGRATPADVLSWARPFWLLTLFYVVVRLFPERDQARRMLDVGAIVGALTGVAAVLAALGTPLADLLQDPALQTVREEEGLGLLARVRLPGLALSYALFFYTLLRFVEARGLSRAGWALVLGAGAANLLVSFNRNMWVALMIGLLAVMLLGGSTIRRRILAGAAATLTTLAVLALSGAGVDQQSRLYPIVERGATIFKPEEIRESQSLSDREIETRPAIRTAREHLLTGIGPGVPYGAYRISVVADGELAARQPRRFLHNQYLYMVLLGGIPLLLCWLGYLGAALRCAWRAPRDPLVAAAGIGIFMIMLSAVVEIYFSTQRWTTTLAMVAGAIVAMRSQQP